MEDKGYTRDYSLFDPVAYLETSPVVKDKHGRENKQITFSLQKFHEHFKEGVITGKRLLDVGTGPVISSIISASPHFQDIYLSDVAPSNLTALKKWWDGSDMHFQYMKPTLQYCIDLSGRRQILEELNTTLRKKVKGILKIDVLSDNPFGPNVFAPFDAITSKYCLDAACMNAEEYTTALQNLSNLLVEGGRLVLSGTIKGTTYDVAGVTFPILSLSSKEHWEIYKSVGLEIEKWEEIDMTNDVFKYRHFDACFVLAALKK